MLFFKDGLSTNDALVSNTQLLDEGKDFTQTAGNYTLLDSVAFDEAKYFTDDSDMSTYPFYIKGYFGVDHNTGKPITKVVTPKFKTQESNLFIMQREDNIVKLLVVSSTVDAKLSDVVKDAQRLSTAINGIGVSSGLCLAKFSVGLFS